MRRPGAVIPSLLPVLLIVLSPMAMLWTLWLDPLSAGEDDVGYYYPLRVMVGHDLRLGRWPRENPLEATGSPLLADPQAAVFHPATWLFAVMDPKLAYTLSLYLGFAAAGGGTYLYLRRIGLARSAACFGAVAFEYCGFLVGHRVHLSILLAAAMMPWGLWCIERLRRGSGKKGTGSVFAVQKTVPVPLGARPEMGTGTADSAEPVPISGPAPASVLPWLAPMIYLALTAGHWPTFIHIGILWLAYGLLRARPLARSLGVWVLAGAIAALAAAPQLAATAEMISLATRQRIGYAMAGENSFFPACAVLALFPFLMGNRTPNFFSQPWWGSWNQCEMLGYVGLATLVLAGAAVWKLYRKPSKRSARHDPELVESAMRPLVRVWTWMSIGAGIWMLGYYLPTYKLIHMIPVLGILRCPARMVLAVDFALAALAAIAIHVVSQGRGRPQEESDRETASGEGAGRKTAGLVQETIQRGAIRVLPIAMIATLVVVALCAWGLGAMGWWSSGNPFFIGGAREALAAVNPLNPAVWTALLTSAATVAIVVWWLRQPAARSWVLVALVLCDLFVLTRYVDTASPAREMNESSPAAAWLIGHAPGERNEYHPEAAGWRVWGLSRTYCQRQRELLLPKTCAVYDIASIAGYGPFQSPAHAHLLGFNICGYIRDWADLLRRNRLLGLYDVRYILAEANGEFEEVLRSVRVSATQAEEVGENLIRGGWTTSRADFRDGVWRLQTPWLWSPAEANATTALEPNTIYRISLEARGPEGGAANYLRAEVFQKGADFSWFGPEEWGLTVAGEQIGGDWRVFRWTFATGPNVPQPLGFRLYTMSERPIEVRDLALRKLTQWESPESPGSLPVGSAVYEKVATLPAVSVGDPPIVIYENKLAGPDATAFIKGGWSEEEIEALKWNRMADVPKGLRPIAPPLGLYGWHMDWTRAALITTCPALAMWAVAVGVGAWRGARRRRAAGAQGAGGPTRSPSARG